MLCSIDFGKNHYKALDMEKFFDVLAIKPRHTYSSTSSLAAYLLFYND